MDNSLSNDVTHSSQTTGLGQSPQMLIPGLYVVATPLGNLRDITLRALDVLMAASVIYCEDTRRTAKLAQAYGITAKTVRCDAHTEKAHIDDIAARVQRGEKVALVSDAGTPAISDPGAALVAACRARNLPVIPIPGASAVTAALSVAGLMQNGFSFLGFLPPRSAARRQSLHAWAQSELPLVLYEAPQRVAGLLEDIQAVMGARHCFIARELTKNFEQFYSGTTDKLQEFVTDESFKGEVVLIVHPADVNAEINENTNEDLLRETLQQFSLREAVAHVTAKTGLPRKQIYAQALKLQREQNEKND